MKIKTKHNLISAFIGITIGFINGILGAGGGMIAVPALQKLGFSQKESHKNAIAVILPITIVSAIFYIMNDSFIYIPTGLLGTIIGTFLLKKISGKWLKRIFSILMIYAGIRLLLK